LGRRETASQENRTIDISHTQGKVNRDAGPGAQSLQGREGKRKKPQLSRENREKKQIAFFESGKGENWGSLDQKTKQTQKGDIR